ncbi:hypothetical protein [Arcobacter roscoffensis]|uniref:Uncharacterized protein n=1 Tax=Arcobacter roscoffensis TaxID=2961520 RepID=A0ABY5E782_9BACT|nr:hypothetical protein [Arcobacter roscoffensis]UTJ06590.1 hypothetical protein NJU99_00425 [Arcobacter roscoffensis]|tara:strand:+ start:468 stop:680 length:213 start_codon:yes stop_codon:yes gene_type:complete
MKVTILSKKDLPNIEKIQDEFDIFRVVKVKTREKLDMIEFFNKDGVFRGFGKDTKAAYKKAKKALKSYYN